MLTVLLHPTDHHSAFNNQEDFFSNTSFGSLSRPHTHKKTPAVLAVGMPSEPQPSAVEIGEGHQSSPSPAPAPSLLQETVGEVRNENKVNKPPGRMG